MLFEVPRVFLLSLAIGVAMLAAYVFFGELGAVQNLTREDGVVENATVLAYIAGAMFCIAALWKRQSRLFAGLWLVLCIFFVGEETSWFQRAIGYSVPAIEKHNSQAEFNFHNLDFVHGNSDRAFLDEDGELRVGWHKLLSSQSLFRIGFFNYFLLFPLLLLVPFFRKIARRFNAPDFDRTVLAVAWGLIVLTIPLTLLADTGRRLPIAECRELVYALTIALYIAGFSLTAPAAQASRARSGLGASNLSSRTGS